MNVLLNVLLLTQLGLKFMLPEHFVLFERDDTSLSAACCGSLAAALLQGTW